MAKFKVYYTIELNEIATQIFESNDFEVKLCSHNDEETYVKELAEFQPDAIMCRTEPITAKMMDTCTNLKVIGISHHGNFDLALCLVLDVGKFYCNNSKVIVRIGTFDLAFYRLIVDKADGKRRCTADNVVVCRNQELIVVLSDNNSGSACRNFLACGSEECLNFFHRCRRNCYQRRHRTRCNIFHGHLAGCFYGIGGITAVCCRCCGGRRNCNFLLLLCCCTDHFRTDCCSPNENTACHESEARCHGKCHAPFFCG